MASSRDSGGLKQEIIGIALLAFALYAAVSLFSYGTSSNWGGVIGANISGAFLFTIGYTSYLFPFILVFISIEFLLRRFNDFRIALPVSFAVFVLASSALLSGITYTDRPGGAVGNFLSRLLSGYLGATGAVIILSGVVLIALLVATGISAVQLGIKIFPPAASLIKKMFGSGTAAAEDEEDEDDEDAEEDSTPAEETRP